MSAESIPRDMPSDAVDPESLLARFGLKSFRPGQRDVVDAIASGEDVLCVMPTGGGKSLCYQLPSLARKGTTIVVSPLIALMKDQVDTLQRLGIAARLINSTLTAAEQDDVMRQMASGALDLVYVAPERLRNGRFLEAVSHAGVSLLAIDEAHCASEWGHDFRPDYARLGHFRSRYLGGVQTIALTATATPHVRTDIKAILGMDSPREFVTGFARTNLRFSVESCKSDREKNDALLAFLRDQPGSGIIYAATRKRCEEVADWLPQKLRRPIGVYHAGLEPDQRRRVQEDFMSGRLSAIVATNAFGMGIDKADIRFVAHYNIPGSLEAYYQEAGRAGRDGAMSECRLFFSYSDRYVQEFFIESRYPSPEVVRKVYNYLLAQPDDPIELTLQQVRDAIQIKETAESVGTAETLIARAGVLKRLDSSANAAILRIDSDLPTLVDLLPREAKIRRKVLQAAEKIVGKRRGEDVYIRPQRLAETAGVQQDQLVRSLRELTRLKAFDYVPPFRGRAVHFTQRDVSFDDLKIDFEELGRRKGAEYEKLEAVIEFARTPRCRQRSVLDYFGDPNVRDCGMCDRCDPTGKSMGEKPLTAVTLAAAIKAENDKFAGLDQAALTRGIRIVLSGIKRMHGRFGKAMIAQMLGGSQNKKIQQWKLNRLSTFGMLSGLKQPDLVDLLDAVMAAGMAQQVEVEERRPTVQLTPFGEEVMHAREPLPDGLKLTFPLAKKLTMIAASIEGGDVSGETATPATGGEPATEEAEPIGAIAAPSDTTMRIDPAADNGDSSAAGVLDADLASRLKRWRGKTSAALGMPAYRVLTNATIERLATDKPASTEELEMIQGVGPSTVEQFGYDLIRLINEPDDAPPPQTNNPSRTAEQSFSDTGLADSKPGSPAQIDPARQEPMRPIATGDDPERPDSKDAYWTWRMLRDGYTWADVMMIRRKDADGIVDDLIAAAIAGHDVNANWIVSPANRQRFEQNTSG
jgi:ATP-dependent DNA helicase RecQ